MKRLAAFAVAAACSRDPGATAPPPSPPPTAGTMTIDRDQAIEIAHRDSNGAYRDAAEYEAVVVEQDGRWRVTFGLRDRELNGGGAVYVIAGDTGAIVTKRYYQ